MSVEEQKDINLFKLITGEEIVAALESAEDDRYVISNPFIIQPTLDMRTGSYMVLPWLIGTDFGQVLDLERSSVVIKAEPSDEFTGGYIRALDKWANQLLEDEFDELDDSEEDSNVLNVVFGSSNTMH